MPQAADRADILGSGWSTGHLALLLMALLACWVATHWNFCRDRVNRLGRAIAFTLRAALASAACWAGIQILGRAIYLGTPWPLWLAALVGGTSVETTIALYRHESGIVGPGRARLLIALRSAAIVTLTLILLQPLLAVEKQRRLQREIAILVDDSASMHLTDQQLTPTERLKLATLLGMDGARRSKSLTDVQRGLQLLDRQLAAEAGALEPRSGVSEAAANSLISRQLAPLKSLLETATDRLASLIGIAQGVRSSLPSSAGLQLASLEDRIQGNILVSLTSAQSLLSGANYRGVQAELQNARRQIAYILEGLPGIIQALDANYYESLSKRDRAAVDSVAENTRSAIARQALIRDNFAGRLGEDYTLRFFRFGQHATEFAGWEWLESGRLESGADSEESFELTTDLTAALESAMTSAPAGSLAGILLLSDGRHTGDRPVEEVAQSLGLQQIPLCAIAIGSSAGPRDAGVLGVRVPDTVYLDDRFIIQADLKLDGLEGEAITVSLLEGDRILEEKKIEVTEGHLRTTARFAHTPEKIGISSFTVLTSLAKGEAFAENNRWEFDVAVSDDRTNVLLIENFPRWEFRYLRNLFHGRDRSVHLQYVLLHPDQIADSVPVEEIHASAERRFGDSEATALPTAPDDWLEFDAIILGDIPPETIDEKTWEQIKYCISERGALLVTIAGPRHMPHGFSSPVLKELLPISFSPSAEAQPEPPEPSYRLRLSPIGRRSPIMQQSPDPKLNELIWGSLPSLHWRHRVNDIKPGAEVLAYAHPGGASENRLPTREVQNTHALIATQPYGSGKVLSLNFDRTWRLRYGVGDLYHHRFWGQVLRWGVGENLRAGNQFIRLGTDKVSYRIGDPIKVTARLLAHHGSNPDSIGISAAVYRDGQRLTQKALAPRPHSNGTFEAEFPAPPSDGRFQIRIDSDAISGLEGALDFDMIETDFLVGRNRNAVELADLSANPVLLQRLAASSGGSMTDPDDAASLRRFFAAPGQIVREKQETTLWDNFPLLLLFLGLLTAEWILRRRSGLA